LILVLLLVTVCESITVNWCQWWCVYLYTACSDAKSFQLFYVCTHREL